MKKILLSIVLICTTILVSAINVTTNLNPFAYNLSAELSADQTTLTVKYCLNADVESLEIVFLKGEEVVKRFPVTDDAKHTKTTADDPYLAASSHSVDVQINDLGTGTFTWRIEVKGVGRNVVERYNQVYSFYLPSSVDIVKDSTSFNYGKVIVVEGSHSGLNNASYHSSSTGAGLYVFNPDFTYRKNRQGNPGFNGGSATWGDISNKYFANTTYAPRRVRVSEDGRIFVASMYKHSGTKHTYIHGDILWEVDPYFSKWTTVMGAGVGGATYDITKIISGGVTYYRNQLETSDGSFIAAPCAGLDVRGKGGNLKLLLLSCDYRAFANNYQGFHLCEYNLGTASTWAAIPSKVFNVTTENATTNPTKQLFATPTNSNVQYDKDGGVWCVSFRATASAEQPALVHKKTDKSEDYRNTERDNTKNAGFRFNNDFTKVIIATTGKIGTVYDYTTKANGYFTNGTAIDMSAVGEYLNDFAWDNANNIYAVGNNGGVTQGSTTGGHVAVYCLPYSNSDVFTTPGPSGFTINCREGLKYTVTTAVNDAAMGSVTGGGTIQSCTNVALKATPNTNYRFVNWTIGGNVVSTVNPYTFMVTDDIIVTANFAPSVFNVTWYNLFQNDQDITDYITNPISEMDGKVNARLWRLFQVALNEAITEKKGAKRSDQANFTVNGITHFNIAVFIAGDADNILLDFIGVTDNTSSQLSVRPFKWLGPYIKYALAQQGINSTSTGLTYWKGMLYRFFNRSNKAYTTNAAAYNYGEGNFTEYGKPTHWRSWWADIACELEPKMNYNTPMPITWDQSYTPTTYIQEAGNLTNHLTPGDWYKWNPTAEDANKLLAWRYGDSTKLPSDQTLGPIVHNAYQDGALFATWVDKHIDEEQNNNDVIQLMQNPGYQGTPHALTVSRKLVAGMYNTICFPFTVYINGEGGKSGLAEDHPLKGATVYDLTSMTNDLYNDSGEPVARLNFTQVNKLEAGKPYLIKLRDGLGDVTTPLNFTGITYDDLTYTPGETATQDGVTFHAVINPTEIPASSVILVANNRLAEDPDGGEMLGLRGYFTFDDTDMQTLAKQGRVYLSFSAPTTTSVPLAPEAEKQEAPKAQKILRNGKIYILRDGKTYSITGARVE